MKQFAIRDKSIFIAHTDLVRLAGKMQMKRNDIDDRLQIIGQYEIGKHVFDRVLWPFLRLLGRVCVLYRFANHVLRGVQLPSADGPIYNVATVRSMPFKTGRV